VGFGYFQWLSKGKMFALLLQAMSMASRNEDHLEPLREEHIRPKKKPKPVPQKKRSSNPKPRTRKGVFENKDTPLHKH
jgi:hypothetical protein